MYGKIKQHLQNEIETIKENGLYKKERNSFEFLCQ
jgi:glycine C-acetyltransferase